jgi:hypothetical protein
MLIPPTIADRITIRVNNKPYEIAGNRRGDGLYSEVYPAVPPQGKGLVALKIMYPRSLISTYLQDLPEREDGFVREARILKCLKSVPGVVPIIDAQVVDIDRPVIVEKLLDVEDDLSKQHETLDLMQGFSLSAQLFSMLVSAHKEHILYLEFKREHFFWKWDQAKKTGKLTVIDWNVSRENCASDEYGKDLETFKFRLFPKMDHLFPEQISEIIFRPNLISAQQILLELMKFGRSRRFQLPKGGRN